MDNPETRLIVYGSLAPGGVNAFMLAGLSGEWRPCRIRGRMGAYPGLQILPLRPPGAGTPGLAPFIRRTPPDYPRLGRLRGRRHTPAASSRPGSTAAGSGPRSTKAGMWINTALRSKIYRRNVGAHRWVCPHGGTHIASPPTKIFRMAQAQKPKSPLTPLCQRRGSRNCFKSPAFAKRGISEPPRRIGMASTMIHESSPLAVGRRQTRLGAYPGGAPGRGGRGRGGL